ncbi:MAG TPA: M1 family aminopeptidase [Candidatus Koribacter sp.]|jgi:hypothetical protein
MAPFVNNHPSRILVFLSVFFLMLSAAWADTLSGTVHDPSGAVVPGAQIAITGGELSEPITLTSDGIGNFTTPDLPRGVYSIRVLRDGFEPLEKTFTLPNAASLQLTLEIAKPEVSISVTGKGAAFENSDPVYRELRGVGLGETYQYDNVTVGVDVGTFKFVHGTITLFAPVQGLVSGAIFVGEGQFHLKALLTTDVHELRRRTGADEVNEEFTSVVFRFGKEGEARIRKDLGAKVQPTGEVADVLVHWRDQVRKRREFPLGFSESVLNDESMDNVDADVLAAIYNPKHPAFMNAYIHGKKHHDLRFFVRLRTGAIPQLDSPEEVALVNHAPESLEDGIWYLAHLYGEYANHTANSLEDRRLFATIGYKIETDIGKNKHLYSVAAITFQPLVEDERVMKFSLLPNLRVSRVTTEAGQDLYFIQEAKNKDGSFYAILPQPVPLGQQDTVRVEYAGDKVIEEAGEGSFYVQARSAWYPNLNGFGEHVPYDLTFKVPKKYRIISVGDLKSESKEGDLAVFHWVTPIPVAVAGFNYGEYQKTDIQESQYGYKISGYYLEELPSFLKSLTLQPPGASNNLSSRNLALRTMAPHEMTDYALEQTRAQLQLCTTYYGKIPYNSISITEQPNFSFGQSWPNLVYLPIVAYMDSTQRWMLVGLQPKLTGFVQEVTPHEVAHQWWGHAVSWASYHDQWLSEGFAEFSAGLFLEKAVGGKWQKDYIDLWERQRRRIFDKNAFGVAPNDAGPLWMGLRLVSPRTPEGYQSVTYGKGAYVLQMIHSMMYSNETGDKEFIAMMHDFVESYQNKAASTESFKAIVEKHMTKQMDLQGNHRLDWFFNEWVYGTAAPKYHFEYTAAPWENGKAKLHMTITQSDVDENFGMLIPVYADWGKGMIHLTQYPMIGNQTREFDLIVPSAPKKVELNAMKDVLERP